MKEFLKKWIVEVLVILLLIAFFTSIGLAAKHADELDRKFKERCQGQGGYPEVISAKGTHTRLCLVNKPIVINID